MAATSGNSLAGALATGGAYSGPEDARSSPVPVWTAQVLNSAGEACWQMVESGQQAMQQRRRRHVQRLFHQGRALVLKHLPRDVTEHVSVLSLCVVSTVCRVCVCACRVRVPPHSRVLLILPEREKNGSRNLDRGHTWRVSFTRTAMRASSSFFQVSY